MNIRKTIICTFLFLLSFPEIACCMTVEDLIKSVDNFVNLRMMEIELASVSKELSGLFEDVKKANELKERWATINGVQLCFFHLEGHVYLCAVRGQGICIIHAASCPCRETNHKEDEHHEHLPGKVAEETQPAENSGGNPAGADTVADHSGRVGPSGLSDDNLLDTERMKITPEMSALQRFEARYGKK